MPTMTLGLLKEFEVFPGFYISVSRNGDVYSHDCEYVAKDGHIFRREGRKLKQAIDKYGYLAITVSFHGRRKTYKVHRLVAMLFVPNFGNKPTVNHINGDKTDNRVENLEWATQHEQKIHSIQHGLCIKNLEALASCNERRAKKVLLDGVEYKSIRDAERITRHDRRYIKRHGVFEGVVSVG